MSSGRNKARLGLHERRNQILRMRKFFGEEATEAKSGFKRPSKSEGTFTLETTGTKAAKSGASLSTGRSIEWEAESSWESAGEDRPAGMELEGEALLWTQTTTGRIIKAGTKASSKNRIRK
jgi:hypothetical protein